MKITAITKDNLEYFKGFISTEDAEFIRNDFMILPLGLVADDLEGQQNMAAGAICIRPDDFILNITSLYVSPEYRRRGAGKFLIDETKRIFAEEDMEFNIEFLALGKEQEGLTDFLEEYGFVFADPENEVYRFTVEELKESKLADKEGDGEAFITIKRKVLEAAQSMADKNHAPLPLDGFESDIIDDDVSVGIIKDGKLESFVIFENVGNNTLLLSAAYAKDNSPVIMAHMLEKSTELIIGKYDPETVILVQAVEDSADEIMEKVFAEPKDVSCRYRYVV